MTSITNSKIPQFPDTPQSLSDNRGLYHLMRSRQLTECLEWIEQNIGFTGDAAIFVIALVNEGVL
jgi:hypothetical protein